MGGIALAAGARVRYARDTMADTEPVTRLTAEALCARFDASLRAGGDGVVASDGDGTVWRGDIGDALFDTVVDRNGLREDAREALAAELRALGLDASGDASLLARRLRDAFRQGVLDAGRFFAVQAWAYAGYDEAELAATSVEVLDAFDFEGAVRGSMRRVLAWCRANETPFYLVSASPRAIVAEAARRLDLDPKRVLAMDARVEGGLMKPWLAAPPTYGPGKVSRLRDVLDATRVLAAFGDNTWDAAMLELAAYPVMVSPKLGLRDALAGFDGVFELEDA